ncbi:transmembrane channel-like protein 7 [Haliotis asinina]|uniref:transmembrane channel-like protein 7 n=1 Tax=Haliotis asinina TaxID=109174 RepID=UPI003531B1DE
MSVQENCVRKGGRTGVRQVGRTHAHSGGTLHTGGSHKHQIYICRIKGSMGKGKISPESATTSDVERQKLAESCGIHLDAIHNDQQLIETIKSLPIPVRLKIKLKDELCSGTVGLSTCESWRYSLARSRQKFSKKAVEVISAIEFWGSSFRRIEGHHGTGVLSYFVFLRWMFGLNILLFLLMFGFIIVPTILQPSIDYTASSTDPGVAQAYTCTQSYKEAPTTDVVQFMLHVVQGTGYMEKTHLFYGYYSGSQFLRGTNSKSNFPYNIPLAYFMTSAVCLLTSLCLMARYTAKGLWDFVVEGHHSGYDFCSNVFCSWDYSLSDEYTAAAKHKSISYDFRCDLGEDRYKKEQARIRESCCTRCRLYTLRFLVNVFVVACLAAAGACIFFATKFSTEFVSSNPSANSYLLLLVQFLPSLTLTVLNVIIPLIFDKVVLLEQYSQAVVVQMTLIRTVFLRLSSLAMLIVSMYTEIQCENKDASCGTNLPPCTVIPCWETYAGQQMYRLVIMNFIVTVVKVFLVELPRQFIVNKCGDKKLLQIIGPPVFHIPQNVLDLVYTQAICWIGFFFAPLIPALITVHLFVVFYVKRLSALKACEPSQRPYRASRSNSFFMVVLFIAFFICCIPVIYTMSVLSPSKGCGPFRIYNSMFTVIDETVKSFPSVVESIYNVLTSAAITTSALVLLGLSLYYCSVMKRAHVKMKKLLQQQLTHNGKNKEVQRARSRWGPRAYKVGMSAEPVPEKTTPDIRTDTIDARSNSNGKTPFHS